MGSDDVIPAQKPEEKYVPNDKELNIIRAIDSYERDGKFDNTDSRGISNKTGLSVDDVDAILGNLVQTGLISKKSKRPRSRERDKYALTPECISDFCEPREPPEPKKPKEVKPVEVVEIKRSPVREMKAPEATKVVKDVVNVDERPVQKSITHVRYKPGEKRFSKEFDEICYRILKFAEKARGGDRGTFLMNDLRPMNLDKDDAFNYLNYLVQIGCLEREAKERHSDGRRFFVFKITTFGESKIDYWDSGKKDLPKQ